jgi:Flp pilus assembly protein TadB
VSNEYLRVSDADREKVAERLREHFAAGRLTSEELDERVAAALSAKTAGDLRGLLADLPEPAPAGPQPGQVPPRWSGRPVYGYRRGPRLLPLALILLFAVLLLHGAVGFVVLAFLKIFLVLCLVAAVVGIFTVARFRRRARRFWQSNSQSRPDSHWHHHDEWRGQ